MSSSDYARELADLRSAGLLRSRRTVSSAQGRTLVVAGREVVCFASNNYLGLAGDERVLAAAKGALDRWGWGSGASALVSGASEPLRRLEERLATFEGSQAALVLGSGYLANLAAIRAAAGVGDVVFLDKLNHASIIDASRASGARVRVFGHRDYDRLEVLLGRSAGVKRRLIVTDSLFSMDGDIADLPRLVELKRRYEATLMVDEAHATGVMGERGRGVAEQAGVAGEIDIVVGTLSKALGGVGGFVCGSAGLVDYLVNTARSYVYTTAVPAAACAAAEAAVDIVEQEPERRERLKESSAWLRRELREKLGLETGDSCSQIIPVMLGSAERAVAVSKALLARGFLVPAIRPPTVPADSSRLRVSVMAVHSREDLAGLVGSLGEVVGST